MPKYTGVNYECKKSFMGPAKVSERANYRGWERKSNPPFDLNRGGAKTFAQMTFPQMTKCRLQWPILIKHDNRKRWYKLEHHSRIINCTPRVVNHLSIMFPENIYSTGITHNDCNLRSSWMTKCKLQWRNMTIGNDGTSCIVTLEMPIALWEPSISYLSYFQKKFILQVSLILIVICGHQEWQD